MKRKKPRPKSQALVVTLRTITLRKTVPPPALNWVSLRNPWENIGKLQTFEIRVCDADRIRARGLGIRLD
jgi:hypothetical protein